MTITGVSYAHGQQTRARAENIRLKVHDGLIYVHYDLVSAGTDPSDIRIFFSDALYDNRIYPRTVFGNVGDQVYPGIGKEIVWDALADGICIGYPLRCNIIVDDIIGDGKTGGPGFAALSLGVPGLGDYYVADHTAMKIKPWMRTTTTLGMIGLGIWSMNQRSDKMRLIPGHYVYDRKWSTGELIVTWVPDKYVLAGTNYHLFPNDAEILIGLGAALWIADVFWVMNRGLKNRKVLDLTAGIPEISTSPFLAAGNGMVQCGITLRF